MIDKRILTLAFLAMFMTVCFARCTFSSVFFTLTCNAEDSTPGAFSERIPGVAFALSGDVAKSGTTNSNGQCTFTFSAKVSNYCTVTAPTGYYPSTISASIKEQSGNPLGTNSDKYGVVVYLSTNSDYAGMLFTYAG